MSQKRRLIYRLNIARHSMMKSLDAGCRQALGISVVQLTALMVLHERNGCLMKDLAQALLLDKSAVTGLVKRMQSRGLVQKSVCSQDSRASRLVMTEAGRRALAQGRPLLLEVNQQIEQGFSEQELETVVRFLDQMADVFTGESE